MWLWGWMVLSPGTAQGGWIQDPGGPRKYANIKLGLALETLYEGPNPRVVNHGQRLVGQFGLQAAVSPWMVEASMETSLGIVLAAGWFRPLFRVGYGHVVLSLYPFYKGAAERAKLKSGAVSKEVFQTVGAGATIEYLTYNGHFGFYLETRQTVLEPVGTSVSMGITISPLLVLLFRDR